MYVQDFQYVHQAGVKTGLNSKVVPLFGIMNILFNDCGSYMSVRVAACIISTLHCKSLYWYSLK